AAILACTSGQARHEAARVAAALAADRDYLVTALRGLGITVAGVPASSFVLVKVHNGLEVRGALRRVGFAVRRGGTFPGPGRDWLRIAVRDVATTDTFIAALDGVL